MQQRNHEYVQALEMERTKMVVFERELPLSIELVSRAIESYKQQVDVGGRTAQQHRSDTSEDTTTDDCEPLLELIPIKNSTASETSSESEDHPLDSEKSDWLRSVQLWNQTPDLPPKPENEPSKEESGAGKKGSKSVNKKKSMEQSHEHHATESSSTENKEEPEKSGRSKKEGSSERKQRRCWSQELHRRFTQSLQQLGGAHVATPKQIRDLMKVDGLTNDEVKSHLQKYRLHTRRPSPPPNQSTGSNAQAHQFVVVGGIWVTSSDYQTMPLTMAANREENGGSGCPRIGVYTPMAAPEPQPHQWQQFNPKPQIKSSKNSEGQGDALARCISPSMSSTTRTAPSPIY